MSRPTMESDSDTMDLDSTTTTQRSDSNAASQPASTNKLTMSSLIYNHGKSSRLVSRDDVAEVLDLIYYLIWDYTIIRATFVPREVRNAENERYLAERGFMESATFTNLAAHGRLLYNDIKTSESGIVCSNFERQNLQMLKFASICDNFKQMCEGLTTIRIHFEGRDVYSVSPTRYFIIGNKPGFTSDESITESFQALDIDLGAAESPLYPDATPQSEAEWADFWNKTPSIFSAANAAFVGDVKFPSQTICRKSVSFAEIDCFIPATKNRASPTRLRASSVESGLTAAAPQVNTSEESDSKSANSPSLVLDTPSLDSVEPCLKAAAKPITTPEKSNSESALLLTPPPSAKNFKLKLISRAQPSLFNLAQQVTTKGRKPRSAKTKIVKIKLSKKRAKAVARITAKKKVPWPLLARFEKGRGVRQAKVGRREAKVEDQKRKDLNGEADYLEGVTRDDGGIKALDGAVIDDGDEEMEGGAEGLTSASTMPVVELKASGGKSPA